MYKIFDVNHCLRSGHTGDLYAEMPTDEGGRGNLFYYSNNKAVEVGNRCLCETTTQNQQDNDTENSFPNFVPPFHKRLAGGFKNTIFYQI